MLKTKTFVILIWFQPWMIKRNKIPSIFLAVILIQTCPQLILGGISFSYCGQILYVPSPHTINQMMTSKALFWLQVHVNTFPKSGANSMSSSSSSVFAFKTLWSPNQTHYSRDKRELRNFIRCGSEKNSKFLLSFSSI